MLYYAAIFLVTAVFAYILTPVSKKIAVKLNAIDIPDSKRRIHNRPIPRMGGLAIYISFSVVSLILTKYNLHVVGIVIGGTVIVIGGMLDDIKSLKPYQKLVFQIAASIILIFFGIWVKNITIPFAARGGYTSCGYFGIPITILWVVGITNAVNLIDGLDGLACGICLISSLTLFGVSLISQRMTAVILTVTLGGACLGFLPFNFNPASIFMGDTGAQFLGFTLAAISIQGAIKSAAAVAFAVPILALGIPIYDTLFAMIRRKINNKPIMQADRGHLHHRLLDIGLSQRQAVFVMYSISAILGITAILAMRMSTKKSFAVLIIVCSITLATAVELGFFSRKNNS